jgi:hypothetical protein
MATVTGFLQDNDGVYIDKDTSAKLTYTLDWSQWLPTGQTISTSNWSLETFSGDAAPLVNEAASIVSSKTLITISGGTSGKIYKVYNTITTSGGLIDRRYFRLKLKSRSL